MRKLVGVIAVAATIAGLGDAAAQTYPSRPVSMVVPYAPGGPTDTIARIMAEHMRGSLGQPVIIENVSGAGGSIGVARVARANPDGYTLSVGNLSSHVMNGAVYALPYDLIADFAPVSLLSFQPMLIVARKSLPADDLRGLGPVLN
jgi:tripartite-type tricarboxylate transporter receptor subunit TctC